MKLDRPASDDESRLTRCAESRALQGGEGTAPSLARIGAGKRVASRKRRTKMAALEARLLQCR